MQKLFPDRQANRPLSKRQLIALALPTEHGVWSFWLEPSLLGLALAPSWAGLCLAFAALAAILCQHPLVLYLGDRRRGKAYLRTRVALHLALAFSLLAGSLLLLSLVLANSVLFLLPLAVALPLVAYQFQAKLAHRGRNLLPELVGVSVLATLAVSLVLVAGGPLSLALILGTVMLMRSLPSILYVRARLRLGRGEVVNHWPSILASALAFLAAGYLSVSGTLPYVVSTTFLLLFVRSAFGLSPLRLPLKAKHIGLLELAFGLLLTLSVIAGDRLI